jgi:hypothetical protein
MMAFKAVGRYPQGRSASGSARRLLEFGGVGFVSAGCPRRWEDTLSEDGFWFCIDFVGVWRLKFSFWVCFSNVFENTHK